MTLLLALQVISQFFGVLGAWMISNKNKWGYVCFTICNLTIMSYFTLTEQYTMLIMPLLFTLINFNGFRVWFGNRNKEQGE